jgi:hypothetical protein
MIYDLLKPDGIMVFKKYPREFTKDEISPLRSLNADVLVNFNTLFNNIPYPIYDKDNENVYVKKQQSGGKKYKKKLSKTKKNIKNRYKRNKKCKSIRKKYRNL